MTYEEYKVALDPYRSLYRAITEFTEKGRVSSARYHR